MNEAALAHVDAHVGHPPGLREEHQVPGLGFADGYRRCRPVLFPGRARHAIARTLERVLHEPAAVETRWRPPAPAIRDPEHLLGQRYDPGRFRRVQRDSFAGSRVAPPEPSAFPGSRWLLDRRPRTPRDRDQPGGDQPPRTVFSPDSIRPHVLFPPLAGSLLPVLPVGDGSEDTSPRLRAPQGVAIWPRYGPPQNPVSSGRYARSTPESA